MNVMISFEHVSPVNCGLESHIRMGPGSTTAVMVAEYGVQAI